MTYPPISETRTFLEDPKYLLQIQNKKCTIFFRPDDRTVNSHPQFFDEDEKGISRLGIVKKYGSHETKTPPTFSKVFPVKIKKRYVIIITLINSFENCYEEIFDQTSLISYLSEKYPERTFNEESMVTVYELEYLEKIPESSKEWFFDNLS